MVIEHPNWRPLLSDKAFNDEKYLENYWTSKLWEAGIPTDEIYTYADRLRTPIDQVQELIKRVAKQPLDRQLTAVVRLPVDVFTERRISNENWEVFVTEGSDLATGKLKTVKHEPPCLSLLDLDVERLESQFAVNLRFYFRSWDLLAGYPINVAGLQRWNEQFVKEVNEISKFQFRTGMIIADSKNLHIYDRQYKLVEDMLKNQKDSRRIQIREKE